MARAPVLAAGGIVLRQTRPPLIAVVRLRKSNEWVLPKGKLDDGETPRDAAEREVVEETGHDVSVHEFLGTLAYDTGGRSKIVHYWRMEPLGGPTGDLMHDVKAVDWLPLEAAVERLSRDHERAFLANVGPLALEAARRSRERKPPAPDKRPRRRVVTPQPAPAISAPIAPLSGEVAVIVHPVVEAEMIEQSPPLREQEAIDAPYTSATEPEMDGSAAEPGGSGEIGPDAALAAEDQTVVSHQDPQDEATEEQQGPHHDWMGKLRHWLRRSV
jgi:8-oxo-dGTP diphosphatase